MDMDRGIVIAFANAVLAHFICIHWDFQRRRRIIYSFHALSHARIESDRGGGLDSRLHLHHCCFQRFRAVTNCFLIFDAYDIQLVFPHWRLAITLAAITWYLTIRGRGESARVVFTMLGIFVMMTMVMAIGLISCKRKRRCSCGCPEPPNLHPLAGAFHMLTASMKGLVALSGLEAMSNGI